jgi:hypothetical protein
MCVQVASCSRKSFSEIIGRFSFVQPSSSLPRRQATNNGSVGTRAANTKK